MVGTFFAPSYSKPVLIFFVSKKVQYGEGTECGSQGDIKIKFNHETTQQAKDDLKEKWYFKQCMEQKARPEWSARGGKIL